MKRHTPPNLPFYYFYYIYICMYIYICICIHTHTLRLKHNVMQCTAMQLMQWNGMYARINACVQWVKWGK